MSQGAAAFGRLCVETATCGHRIGCLMAAAFGRLCVETISAGELYQVGEQPPSGGCVLKHEVKAKLKAHTGAAAFGRLCVETIIGSLSIIE